MKIKLEHLQILQNAIYKSRQGMESLDEYVNQHGLTAKRWRWDLLWRADRLGFLPDRFVLDTLYDYMTDDHIDTALRHCTATN